MDIGRKLQQLESRLAKVERSARLSHAAIDNTAVQVRDADGSLRGLIGVQADGTTAVNIVNGPPPPQPSNPIVASVLGGVTVSWDGTFADGSTAPMDWARVEVHAALTAVYDPTPDTLQGTIETTQGATVVVPCEAPVYVQLVARNTSGTASTPSGIVGPTGPTQVVADDVIDGIITTVKLADDAVTQAKIAAAAVGTTEIADDAVTTPKLVAGAVQAGKIAADAVQAGNIAADAVTAREIAALAVTAAELAANSVVAGKIQAGAVDATALAADAITGKTITGGTINGTTITGGTIQTATSGERITLNEANAKKVLVYNSSGTAIGEFSSRGLIVIGSSGAAIWADPNAVYPRIRFYNASAGNWATAQVVESVTGDANLETISGTFTGSGYTDMNWHTFMGNDVYVVERIRRNVLSTVIGGRLYLDPGYASLGYRNTDDATQDQTVFVVQGNLAYLNKGRLQILPVASNNSALYVQEDPAHTGPFARFTRNSVDYFTVDKDGNTTVAGNLAVTATTWSSWTPTISNGGSATFNIRDGWYYKHGKMVYIEAYITLSAAGSGTTGITITLPSTPYRGASADRRQVLNVYLGGLAAGTNSSVSGHGVGLIEPTGTGAQINLVRGPTDILVRGENLGATSNITINGWYREA